MSEAVKPLAADQAEFVESDPLEISIILLEVVRALVDHPASVTINETGHSTNTSILTIHVEPTDVGKVLGKAGSTIKAIRDLFLKIAAVEGRKAIIEVDDPRKTDAPRRTRS